MITAVILNFEQIGHEEYKTIPYVKTFNRATTLFQILEWVHTIDDKKTIKDVYFNEK